MVSFLQETQDTHSLRMEHHGKALQSYGFSADASKGKDSFWTVILTDRSFLE